jgi:hypothetical protein
VFRRQYIEPNGRKRISPTLRKSQQWRISDQQDEGAQFSFSANLAHENKEHRIPPTLSEQIGHNVREKLDFVLLLQRLNGG